MYKSNELLTKMFLWISVIDEDPTDQLDLSCFSGTLRRDDHENGRDCWRISDGNNFRVRSKQFTFDKTKVVGCFLSCALLLPNFSKEHLLQFPVCTDCFILIDIFADSCRKALDGACSS